MKVQIEDKETHIRLIQMSLNLVGVCINYTTAELIHITLEKVNELEYEFSIKDAAEIQANHEEKWREYFKKQKPWK